MTTNPNDALDAEIRKRCLIVFGEGRHEVHRIDVARFHIYVDAPLHGGEFCYRRQFVHVESMKVAPEVLARDFLLDIVKGLMQ